MRVGGFFSFYVAKLCVKEQLNGETDLRTMRGNDSPTADIWKTPPKKACSKSGFATKAKKIEARMTQCQL